MVSARPGEEFCCLGLPEEGLCNQESHVAGELHCETQEEAGAIPTAFAPSAEKGSQSRSDWGMSLNITKFITLGRLLIELSIENNGGIKSQNDAS